MSKFIHVHEMDECELNIGVYYVQWNKKKSICFTLRRR